MKSIMEEASSLVKAIEKAWQRAGKPKEFSLKILEEPEKNFFGLTTKSAKIALVFDERATAQPTRQQQKKRPSNTRNVEVRKNEKKQSLSKEKASEEPTPKPKSTPLWTEDMVNFAQNWLNKTLAMLGFSDAHFTVTASGRHLKVKFSKPLLEDERREKILYSNFAHLIIETLRSKHKRSFKNIGVILTNN